MSVKNKIEVNNQRRDMEWGVKNFKIVYSHWARKTHADRHRPSILILVTSIFCKT